MSRQPGRSNPSLEAFVQTANSLDRAYGGLPSDVLTRCTVLACLRRALLDELLTSGELDARDPGDCWDRARELGCPLLANDLDPLGPKPKRAALLAVRPAGGRDLGQVYQQLGELRLSRCEAGKGISASVTRTDRRRSGSFFTPDWMAERLAGMAWRPLSAGKSLDDVCRLRLIDPACGDGRLLVACIRLTLEVLALPAEQHPDAVRQLVASAIRGIDLDPVAVALARLALWRLCGPARGPVVSLQTAVQVGDSIGGTLSDGQRAEDAVRWDQIYPDQCGPGGRGFDAIVANPPFEVLTGFQRRVGLKRYTERIRQSGYRLALSGNLNTYRLFLERGLELLADEGRLGFVLPFGFLMDRTAAPLRSHMLRSGWVERVEVFPESFCAFEQVGQSVILLAAQKSDGLSRVVGVVDGAGRAEPHQVALDQLAALDAENLALPISSGEAIGLAERMHALNESSVAELAEGRVGELDQTLYRRFIRSEPDETLLVRGAHLSAFRVCLDTDGPHQRWVDSRGFFAERSGGRWSEDLKSPRIVQTGIVNMEAARRLVAAEVPAGVVLGNSVNYWVPRPRPDWAAADLRAYLLGLFNSTPLEWRFRLTSSNNNINLYEIRSLPLPALGRRLPAGSIEPFVEQSAELVGQGRSSPLGVVRQITAGWGAVERDDRTVARLIGRVARMLVEDGRAEPDGWLQHVLDQLVTWHLGLTEPDLDRMLEDVPTRAWKAPR